MFGRTSLMPNLISLTTKPHPIGRPPLRMGFCVTTKGVKMEIKAIETYYKGYRFRSRLEARWAVFFDAAGIKWEYEPEGFVMSDGTKYLPDFYLPESKTFFECKGIMSDFDQHKVDMFVKESRYAVAIGYQNMTFRASDFWGDECFTLTTKDNSALIRCTECRKVQFMGLSGSWQCRCCGAYDGNSYVDWICNGDEENVDFYPLVKAKQARFEHGERG